MVYGTLDDWSSRNGDIYILKESQEWYDRDSKFQEDDIVVLIVRDSDWNMLLLGNECKDVIIDDTTIITTITKYSISAVTCVWL